MRNVKFIEGGKNGEFDFLIKKCSNRSISKIPYGKKMRFYRFHEDYVGYIDIQYVAFYCYRYYIAIALPWTDANYTIICLQKDELRKNNITYMTSFSPIYIGKEEIDS